MHTSEKVKKTIYVNAETLAKIQREVGLQICEGKKASISGRLSDIVEGHYSAKKSPSEPKKEDLTKRAIIDISVLGKEFTSKQLKELYVNNGLNERSADMKILRLKKEKKIEVVGRGKYRLL